MLTSVRSVLEPGRNCWVVAPVRRSGLLVDGRDYFRAFYDAARAARHTILLAGWQFDSDVSLLRGDDLKAAQGETRFLPFLNSLCRANRDLQVRILCWDYSPAYMLQREWMQDLVFNWRSPRNLRFLFDDRHAIGASHHQKFAVIDGALAFAGSMDFCHERWDDRIHRRVCPDRSEPFGEDSYGPYHEVQCYLTGPAAGELVELFEARWRSAGGETLHLPPPVREVPVTIRPSVRIEGAEVGLSRTQARTLVPDQPSLREIQQLYVDAIESADEYIYIENQYFGARAVYDALVRRLRDKSRPRLNVVLIYPKQLHSFTEAISMGSAQSMMFRSLKQVAAETGHALGIYCSASCGEGVDERSRYIHSKVILVDDRFMTVGSANTNNRSMGLDTELNVTWEASTSEDEALAASIRRARVSLIAEHAGIRRRPDLKKLYPAATLVGVLDEWAQSGRGALRIHPMTNRLEKHPLVAAVSMDPERPIEEDEVFERLAPSHKEIVAAGIRGLRRRLRRGTRFWRRVAVNPPAALAGTPQPLWSGIARWTRRLAVPFLIYVLLFGLVWGVLALVRWLT